MKFLLVFLCVAVVNAKVYKVKASVGGVKFNQNVVIDEANNVMTSISDAVVLGNRTCKASVNLHDLNRNIVAIKALETGECVVINADEKLDDEKRRLGFLTRFNLINEITQEKFVSKLKINDKNITKYFGRYISDFCEGLHVYFGIPKANKEAREADEEGGEAREADAKAADCINCNGCTVNSEIQQPDHLETNIG